MITEFDLVLISINEKLAIFLKNSKQEKDILPNKQNI